MLLRLKLRKASAEKFSATIYIDKEEFDEGYLNASLDELVSSFKQWQEAYLGLEDVALRLTPKPEKQSFTRDEINNFAESLKDSFDEWLVGDRDWQRIRERLVKRLANQHEEEIRIFLDVKDSNLRRFPWQDWKFFEEHCPNAEVALYKRTNTHREIPLSDTVRVLVVVGNHEGIEEGVQEELEAIKELEQQKRGIFKVLEQPSHHDLLYELRSKSYQIFIFTGHSGSDNNKDIGWIELSETDDLQIRDLKLALREAITGGLQLCIFNSCDGLGLAKQLNQLQLPLSIVMREPVPDDVAAQFLRVFLESYSGGQSFFQSFREARHRLEGFNHQYPGVCWLPTVCTGTLKEPPKWLQLIRKEIKPKRKLMKVALISIAALIGVSVIYHFFREKQPNVTPNAELLSLGEKNLISKTVWMNDEKHQKCLDNFNLKEDGVQAFKNATDNNNQGDFQTASQKFDEFIQQCPFDPEARIYSNNAKAELWGNTPIQIAASVPIGGKVVGEAQEILRGVAQVQDEINNQSPGINGRPLQVMIANDDTDQSNKLDKATIVAKTLTDNRDILGVIGHYSSDATYEASQQYNQQDLVVISPTSTATRQQVPFENNVFRTPPTDAVAAKKIVNYLEKYYRSVAIVHESKSQYSQSLRQTFIDNLSSSSTIVHECDLSNSPFFASQCVKDAVNKGAETLALFPSSQIVSETQNLVEQNYNFPYENDSLSHSPLPLLGGDAVYGEKTLRDGGQAVNGMIVAVPWHQDSKNLIESSKNFLNQAKQLWKTEGVNWRTASSYDATKALVAGLRQLGNKPTRESLKNVLSSPTFSVEGATGIIEFNSNGDRKITSENQNELGILVQVKCNYNDCSFEPLH